MIISGNETKVSESKKNDHLLSIMRVDEISRRYPCDLFSKRGKKEEEEGKRCRANARTRRREARCSYTAWEVANLLRINVTYI